MKKRFTLCFVVFGLLYSFAGQGQSIANITCLEVQGTSLAISWYTSPNPISFVANHIYATDVTGGISEITQTTNLSGTYTYSSVDASATPVCVFISTEDIVGGTANFTVSETFCSTFLTVSPSVSPPGLVNLQWIPPTNNATWLAAVTAEVWLEYPAGVWSSIANLQGSSTSYTHEVTTCGDELNFQIRYSGLPNCDFASNIAGGFFYDQTAPPIPSFDRVTVNSITNQAAMNWNPFPVGDTYGYLIYSCNGSTVTLLDTVFVHDSSVYSDMLSTPNAGPECYLIAAIDSCYSGTPPSPNTSPTGTTCNCTIYLSPTTYTLCENSIDFSWTPYTGWDNGVDYYVLMNSGPDGIGFTPLDTVDGSTLQMNYEFSTITPGNNYYTIVAFRNGNNGYYSTSNVQTVNVSYPIPPNINYITSVSVNSSKYIDITVRTEATSVAHKYILQRKNLYPPYDWENHMDITQSATNIIFTDMDVNSDDIIYDYRVVVQNPCGYYVDTTNVGRNIRLRGSNFSDLLLNNINWSTYEDWENGVNEYLVLRSVDGNAETTASSVNGFNLAYSDDLEPFLSSKGNFCYRIQANSEPISYFPNETFSSYSNKKCLDQEPLIWIPNAMMIDGENNLFYPVISFADTSAYTMNIFSRWGDYIFESSRISNAWDGKMNGEFVHENAYVYYITVKNGRGVLYERRGTITVLNN